MRVTYGGVEYEMPSDSTDEEVLGFLDNLGASDVEAGAPAVEMGRLFETADLSELEGAFTIGEGEQSAEVNFMKLNQQQKQFVDKIRQLETGGLQNPFIRTKAKGTGSSAYGPYQITKGLIQSTLKASPDKFTPEEQALMQDLAKRQQIALAVGGKDRATYSRGGAKQAQGAAWAKQYGFDSVDAFLSAFDYGGDYGLGGDSDFQIAYESVAHKMLVAQLEETGGDALEAASRWHGGTGWKRASSRQHTDIYRQRFQKLA
jgi:hypothetical protein